MSDRSGPTNGWAALVQYGLIGVLSLWTVRVMALHARGTQPGETPAWTATRTLPAPRAPIRFRDLAPAAEERNLPSIYAVPRDLPVGSPRRETAVRFLGGLLGHPPEHVDTRIGKSGQFRWIARWVDPDLAERLRAADLKGIGIREEPSRFYPEGPLAAHIIGFVGIDRALGGIELQWDSWLRGEPGALRILRDARRWPLWDGTGPERPPRPGGDVILTIDRRIQRAVEMELERACAEWEPERACAIVMDPATGDLLAMTSRPTFDPNRFREADRVAFENYAMQSPFEPGSTFKPFVIAEVLERGLAVPETEVDCEYGAWRLGYRTLHDHHPFGVLALHDVIVQSSNIGAAKQGVRLGPERLHEAVRRFGFGRPTGIDLGGESAGIVRPLDRWRTDTLMSIPIGHEIAATPLQLLAGFNVFANDGRWVPPRVVHAVTDPEGNVREMPRHPGWEVLSERTTGQVGAMLRDVVVRGTGRRAGESAYSIAGKTGTAQKLIDGEYSRDRNVTLFVCYAPADAPRVSVMVLLDDPKGERTSGGRVAAPVAAAIVDRVLPLLGVPPIPSQ